MLIIISGLKGSGKSVGLEIIKNQGYHVFSVDKWIHDIYAYGERGYNVIQTKLGDQFVDQKGVKREAIKEWLMTGHDPETNQNQNLRKLNAAMLPIIKSKLVELKNQASVNDELIFVELATYVNDHQFFRDAVDDVIYLKRDNLLQEKPGVAAYYLSPEIHSSWKIVENNSTINQLTTNVINAIDEILPKYLRKRFHIKTENIK
ncbi:dephospho-CoA kinase [Mycoplasmoides fastidiosum]|uniref:Dephospho-CoA kinase n=1 Tax=Mycoplasmoides fastidiosum TaxID=92758 RepID=A0ABU0LZL2_9BACT|nr:dephospho-CoA kinase [Mycoplasmoides fastidiosum]MDQ0514127.1 dephospho-CoA kinase [Mycoplasmoides fastidiosum]UUD37465.1 dephospho-CoA kinase [Mycoplasmoides fastidiosum]